MKLGSLFDGIGGFPLAALKNGITPVWASEIEKFPIEVTKKHFPDMRHLGDITQINGTEIEPVDIITFGSPCQDLSIAGKREGLSGERSGLFSHAVRIIREMRAATDGKFPRFAVWENVPGAFSSNKGQDFRAVIEEIAETEIPMPRSGKWATAGMVRTATADIAWRTIDAQHWGVPQRRKRIFLVADFAGQCAGEILFKPEGLSRHLAESGEAREEAAGTARGGTCFAIDHVITTGGNCTAQGPCVKENGPMFTLKAAGCHSVAATVGDGIKESIGIDAYNFAESGDIAVTLTANSGSSPTHAGPAVMVSGIIPFDTTQTTSPQNGNNPKSGDPCHPLCANAHVPSIIIEPRSQDGICRVHDNGIALTLNSRMGTGGNRVPVMLAFGPGGQHEVSHAIRSQPSKADKPDSTTYVIQNATRGKSQNGLGISQEDVSYTLDSLGNHAVAYPDPANTLLAKANLSFRGDADTVVAVDCRNLCENKELSGTLQSKDNGGYSLNYQNPVRIGYAVRRLTPLECERLQGFPDNWTNIPGASDTARYKAIGNSVAIPCVQFIMRRIKEVIGSTER